MAKGAPDSLAARFERHGPGYRWLVTATVMMGTIATILTATIVNVALPDIMGALGMGQDQAQLLSTGFLAAMTGTMLVNAWMVDSFGQRFTYLASVALFTAASIVGGLAPTSGVLILARILQGAAAGVLQPLAMQTIFQVFPPEKRGSAMGIYAIGVVLAPALGPTLGGIMIDSFSWRYIFFMPLPFCVAGVFMGLLYMPGRMTDDAIKRFDWVGFGLMIAFLVFLLTALSNGSRDGWTSDIILIEFTLAVLAAAGFFIRELTAAAPLLNFQLFTHPVYAAAALISFIFGAGLFGSTFLVPLFVQTIQGYTPTLSGLLLMPAGLAMGVVFPIAGRLSDRVPAHITILAGLALFALSSILLANIDGGTSFWQLAWWTLIGRVGLGFIMPSLNAGALKALPLALVGQGTGAINFIRQLGSAFGVNLLTLYLSTRTQVYAHHLAAAQTTANSSTTELIGQVSGVLTQAGLSGDAQAYGAMSFLGQMVYVQSNIHGYRDSFMLVGLLFLLTMLPTLMLRQRRAAA
ncbi:DHA2 family efflux MFS transporter permease subunit [Saccharospirillum mangrovi]|uniref:DHA2 family efflux MFS transporter permease subunit n=1 Tax=Saccharospirillum mangrovi TaxID=2161747 RepID=UPI0018E4FD3D|nr:DHA2 family efflux MFS transporter permease subunit [Saccharospirillum mangrovi]